MATKKHKSFNRHRTNDIQVIDKQVITCDGVIRVNPVNARAVSDIIKVLECKYN